MLIVSTSFMRSVRRDLSGKSEVLLSLVTPPNLFTTMIRYRCDSKSRIGHFPSFKAFSFFFFPRISRLFLKNFNVTWAVRNTCRDDGSICIIFGILFFIFENWEEIRAHKSIYLGRRGLVWILGCWLRQSVLRCYFTAVLWINSDLYMDLVIEVMLFASTCTPNVSLHNHDYVPNQWKCYPNFVLHTYWYILHIQCCLAHPF